jgi:hypothetical protein
MKRFLISLLIAVLAFILGISAVGYIKRCGLSFKCEPAATATPAP